MPDRLDKLSSKVGKQDSDEVTDQKSDYDSDSDFFFQNEDEDIDSLFGLEAFEDGIPELFEQKEGMVDEGSPSCLGASVSSIKNINVQPEDLTKPGNVCDNLLPLEPQQKVNQFRNRIVFGLSIGITVGGVVLAGGWVFTAALATAVFARAREYFELVRSRGITAGMTPPPCYVSQFCSVICALMPMSMMYHGHTDVSVTSAAFVVAMALLSQRGNPTFAQLSSGIFGLFYCGYLPCFWVKLRCGLAAPALTTRLTWPVLLGGQAHWTVGLVATFIAMSSIIAADTFTFLGGKVEY